MKIWSQLGAIPKAIIIMLPLVGAYFYAKHEHPDLVGDLAARVFPAKQVAPSAQPLAANLPTGSTLPAGATNAPATPVANAEFPQLSALDLQPGCTNLPEVRWGGWFWNTHHGVLYANGGTQATKGSKMCLKGVNLKYVREDDTGKQNEGLTAFAEEYARGVEFPAKGFAIISLMGDGNGATYAGLNPVLTKLGPEYRAETIGFGGYSRGEDCIMGPPAWKADPQQARGGVCSGVLRDGDWNVGMKWLGDNGICNNPDEGTYDPDCMNWVAAADYLDAPKKYNAGYAEDRPVVQSGKKTGKIVHVAVNCTVTWTPGDKMVVDARGGLVKLASTAEYRYQMPMSIIVVRKWARDHRELVDNLLDAMLEANVEITKSDVALRRAAAISALVYHEQGVDARYEYDYFFGKSERDKQGNEVRVGGSSVINLADNCELFGLQSCAPGSQAIYRATYETFGAIAHQQYPKLVPVVPKYEEIADSSFIEDLVRKHGGVAAEKPDRPTFEAARPVTAIVSKRAWHINFATGQAAFSKGAEGQLQQLLRDLTIAGGLAVEVHGHTDNVGSAATNKALSERRAFAVKQWLESHDSAHFGKGHIRTFAHGDENPLEPNETEQGRAQNRRVEVILGTTG